jgi:ABC-2 type transport system ATP-binding protein
MTSAIETHGLTRRFGRLDAVDNLDLRVPAGSIFALVGPNAAGKTTTIKMLLNLVRPTRGSAVVLGADCRRLGTATLQRIGYVSENQRLPEWMTPSQLIAYCRPFYPRWDDALADRLTRQLSLDLNTPLKALSRGTRMKAALLVSLAYRPELVILDEPFTGLDPLVRDELIRGLLELAGEQPWTVLVSSHDIEEVERLADWIGFMDGGHLVFSEPVAQLLDRCRLVEVVAAGAESPRVERKEGWLYQGTVGRTVSYIDMRHDRPNSSAEIVAAYPGAQILTSPVSLREVFVALARARRETGAARGEAA